MILAQLCAEGDDDRIGMRVVCLCMCLCLCIDIAIYNGMQLSGSWHSPRARARIRRRPPVRMCRRRCCARMGRGGGSRARRRRPRAPLGSWSTRGSIYMRMLAGRPLARRCRREIPARPGPWPSAPPPPGMADWGRWARDAEWRKERSQIARADWALHMHI